MSKPRYSICITTYQAGKTIRTFFNSLLNQIDDRFEIIVVDNFSSDGSEVFLQSLAERGLIRLIRRKCSRGLGRQIAAESAFGDVLIQQIDADQVYGKFLEEAVEVFEVESSRDPEVLLFVKGKKRTHVFEREPVAATLVYKDIFLSKTRWPDINYGEDVYVYEPFIREGHVRYLFVDEYAYQLKGGVVSRLINSVANYQQFFMSGFSLAFVTRSTRYSGFLFYARAFIVHLSFLYFLFKKLL